MTPRERVLKGIEYARQSRATKLNLSGFKLTELPPEIGKLTQLTKLYLRENDLPIPPELLEKTRDPKAILDYYFSANHFFLNEAKLILVGQGEVGKTSLVKGLIWDKFDPNESITHGINIDDWEISINPKKLKEKIKLHVWDFGGQEIMHATHQFFLTTRSLYLLVLSCRAGEESSKLDYWIEMIKTYGKESPIIVVCNKKDDGYHIDLNRKELCEQNPGIVRDGFVSTSCRDGKGIADLKEKIKIALRNMKYVRDLIPLTWSNVKQELEGLKQNFITYLGYQEVCKKHGVLEQRHQETLIRLLHDLGVALHFHDDPKLKDTGILNPEWVIYAIITSEELEGQKGILRGEQLDRILDKTAYPQSRHWFIIDMMRKFELCFDMGSREEQFLIPELLPQEEPPKLESFDESLRFEYHYDFLPGSIISRFIVRLHRFIHKQTYWKHGVVLVNNRNRALVKAIPNERKITIQVIGEPLKRKELWSIIQQEFAEIHGSMEGLKSKLKVPVPGHPHTLLDYNDLKQFNDFGQQYYPVVIHKKMIQINISQALDGIRLDPKTREEAEAAQALERYLDEFRRGVHPQDFYRKVMDLGNNHYQWEQFTLARQAFQAVHEALQELRSIMDDNKAQVSLSEENETMYARLVRCFLKENQIDKAFEYAASAKGRAFIKQLVKNRTDFSTSDSIDKEFQEKLKKARELRKTIEKLSTSDDRNQLDSQDKRHLNLRKEQDLWSELHRDFPARTSLYSVPELRADQAQKLSKEMDAVLVEYFRDEEGWGAFVIDPDQVCYKKLPGLTKPLMEKLEKWRQGIHHSNGRSLFLLRRLEELYHAAIEPLNLPTSPNRLVIAPYGELHLLPLSVAKNRATKRYLIDDFEISFVSPLCALQALYAQHDTQDKKKEIGNMLSVAYPGEESDPTYLNGVIEEAEQIKEELAGIPFKDLHKEKAIVSEVRKEIPKFDAVHIGCHGRFDSKNPTNSGLKLKDGNLNVSDILSKMQLSQTRLVALAACLSGELGLKSGEEHTGLLRAFMTAGAETVVASQWKVDDYATRDLFSLFYTGLAKNYAPAQIMRQATKCIRKENKWDHPFFWAGFQINGLNYPPKEEIPDDLLSHSKIHTDSQNRLRTRGNNMRGSVVENANGLLDQLVGPKLDTKKALEELKEIKLQEKVANERVDRENPAEVARAIHLVVKESPYLKKWIMGDSWEPYLEKIEESGSSQPRFDLKEIEKLYKSERLSSFVENLPEVDNNVEKVRKQLIKILKSVKSADSY